MIESEIAVIFFKRKFNPHYSDNRKIKTNKSAFKTKLVWLIESDIAVIFFKQYKN